MKENEKEILDSLITFPVTYHRKNINILKKNLTNRLFSLQYDVQNFVFLLKYCKRRVGLNTSQKLLAFVTIRHRKFHLCVQLSTTKIPYLRKKMHLWKDAAFYISFKEKLRKYDISVKLKHAKTNKNTLFSMIFSQILVRRKFFF